VLRRALLQHGRRFNSSHAGAHGAPASAEEPFLSPGFRTMGIVAGVGFVLYKATQWSAARNPEGKSWLTRVLESSMTPEAEVKRLNWKHFELSRESSERKLLFQSAQPPPFYRLRYPDRLNEGSPYNISPGSVADLGKKSSKVE